MIEIEELTKEQQAAVLAFERLMKRFAACGLGMFSWSGTMYAYRVNDYAKWDDQRTSFSTITIPVDNHRMSNDGGDPN